MRRPRFVRLALVHLLSQTVRRSAAGARPLLLVRLPGRPIPHCLQLSRLLEILGLRTDLDSRPPFRLRLHVEVRRDLDGPACHELGGAGLLCKMARALL